MNRSKLRADLEKIFGLIHDVTRCQVALRFPGERVDINDPEWWKYDDHIDNYTEKDMRIRRSIPRDFSALVGIWFTDNLEDDSGNFVVFPGGHQ